MTRLITILTLSLIALDTLSQDDWRIYPKNKNDHKTEFIDTSNKKTLKYDGQTGEIKIIKDSRVDSVSLYLAEIPLIKGFTIQIEVSQQTEIIKAAKLKFIKAFPDHPINDEYIAPNTYLYAGRFYDKNSAYAFKKQILPFFKNTIVIDKEIEPPILE